MTAAVALAPGVWRVPTLRWDLLNSFVIRAEDGSVTLVDTGLKSAPPRILAALAEIGSGPSDVTTILLTHAHGDHAGGAAELARLSGRGITVHEVDAPYVRTGTAAPRDPSLRLGRLLHADARAWTRPRSSGRCPTASCSRAAACACTTPPVTVPGTAPCSTRSPGR